MNTAWCKADDAARSARSHHRRIAARHPRDAWAVQREDGSWLLDGLVPVPELKARLEFANCPTRPWALYLGLRYWPNLGTCPAWSALRAGWIFEVVDLDGKRIDKVLALREN
jgi:putative hemolysin